MEDYLQTIKKARQGDVQAFAELYERLYEDLYKFALYTLRNVHDAEDMVSETVTDAFAGIRKLRSEEAFRQWMFRILSNKCKMRLREYARKTVPLEDTESPEAAARSMSSLFTAEPQKDVEEHILVRTLFFELEEEERLIIAMHQFGGYKSREIAKILRMNENTVRSKESRGLKKMAEKL